MSGFSLHVGKAGRGDFNQSGGTNTGNFLSIGNDADSNGTYTLSGTGVVSGGFMHVGLNGTGTFNQTGGNSNGSFVYVGTFGGSSGTYNLSGGSVTLGGNAYIGGGDFGPGGSGVLNVSGSGVLTVDAIQVFNTTGTSVNLSGGTINSAALNFNGVPSLLNWTGGTLNINSNITFDSAAGSTTTSAAFGTALTLGTEQTLRVTGNETLGGVGAFGLTLNSGGAHHVTGTLTLNSTGTITQNTGSTLYAATFIQAGGTVNGTLQNQTTFTYQSGLFNGRLLNQGVVSFGSSFTAGNGVENHAAMTLNLGQTLTVNGAGLDNRGTFTLAGGAVNGAGPLNNNSVLNGHGVLAGNGGFVNNGLLTVSGGSFSLANSAANSNAGQIDVPGGQQLQLAGAALANTGTINLAAGAISGSATLNNTTGIISGHGTISAPLINAGTLAVGPGILNVATAFTNSGEIYMGGGVAILGGGAALTNTGLIRGDGAINNVLNNNATGEIRAESGKRIKINGASGGNAGLINLDGGTVELVQALINASSGKIIGRGVLKVGGAGLTNQGHVAFSSGISDVFGDVTNDTGVATRDIGISGNADVTFWDDVTNTSGLFRVSANSSATFFGGFAGGGISGPGDVYFDADITPGSSPGLAEFGGNVHFGPLAGLEIEIAGTTKGTQYDALDITGAAALDGTLDVALLSFAPSANDVFEIIYAAAGITGTFASTNLPALDGDLFWNLSYGTNSVTLAVAAPGLDGDHNADNTVDALDYVLWRKTPSTYGGDPDGYNTWRAHFGQTSCSGAGASANAAVPEPTTVSLVLLFLAAAGAHLRRRHSA